MLSFLIRRQITTTTAAAASIAQKGYSDLFGKSTFNQTLETNKEVARTIHPAVYYDQENHTLEMKRIYEDDWVVVGHTCQLDKHNIIHSHIHTIPVIITKNANSSIRCFYNTCRHRGSLLVTENKKGSVITCPYHKWTYSLNGDLIGTPMCKHIPKEEYPLFSMDTEIHNSIIFANCNTSSSTTTHNLENAMDILRQYPLETACTVAKEKT